MLIVLAMQQLKNFELLTTVLRVFANILLNAVSGNKRCMSSTELFRKHFGDQSASVSLKHPNIEAFFNDLNQECLNEKWFVVTQKEGVKQYVRRKSISSKGKAAVTMTTTNPLKALNFGTLKNATDFLSRIGIGYAIEVG